MEVFDLSDKTERVLLVGVQENDGDDTEESLQELAEILYCKERTSRSCACRCDQGCDRCEI